MRFPEKMLLKLPAGTLGRIDGVTSNRNDWVRGLIDQALEGEPALRAEPECDGGLDDVEDGTASPRPKLSNREEMAAADDVALLALVRRGPEVVRRAAAEMSWMGRRVERSAQRLAAADKLSAFNGLLVVNDE